VPTLIDQAIVLRQWDYSETSQTVALLTRAHGRLKGIAKGARREKGSFGGGFEPLTRGEIVAIVKPSTDLATLTEWDLQEVFWAARRNLWAHRAGLYFADLAYHAIVDEDPHPGLFDAAVSGLRALREAGESWDALLRFQWSLLVEMGLQPRLGEPGDREKGGVYRFDPRSGGVGTATEPEGDAWRVRGATIELLRTLESGGTKAELLPDADATRRGARLLAEYLRFVLDRDLPTRKSLFGR